MTFKTVMCNLGTGALISYAMIHIGWQAAVLVGVANLLGYVECSFKDN